MSAEPSDNLYITGLPPDVDDQKLRAIFGAYAEITSTKVLNNPTGQGFCAALCRFASVQAATWIVQSLHGNIPEGLSSPIQVKFANPGGGKGGGGKGMWGAGGMGADGGYGKGGMGGGMGKGGPYAKQPAPPSDNLYVTGMPSEISQEQVAQIFSGYGTVVQSKLLGAKAMGPSQDGNAAALIRYVSVAEATKVKDMLNGNIPEGLSAPINIRFADQKEPSGGKGGGFGAMGKGPGSEAPPSDNLYITGLPEQCGPQDLSTLFGAFGTVVSSKVLGVKFGKAAAMVRFSSVEEASQVKANMDGQVPPGCQEGIKINFADTPESKANRKGGKGGEDTMAMAMFAGGGGAGWTPEWAGGGKGGFGGGKGKGKDGVDMNAILKAFEQSGGLPGSVDKENQIALYVSGLPPNCEDVHLYRLFSPFGPIAAQGVRAMMWPDGSCKGFGFVNYLDVMSANAAIESVNGAVLPNGTVMKVAIKTDKGAPKEGAPTGMEGLTPEQAQLQLAAAQAEAQLLGQQA